MQGFHSRGHRGWIINVASAAGLVGAKNSGDLLTLPPSEMLMVAISQPHTALQKEHW